MAKRNVRKTRYNKTELKEFRNIINEKLEKAQEQLAFYMNELSENANNADAKLKGMEDGVTSMETERLTNMAGRQKKLVQYLQNALLRIENGVYGVCRESGQLISKERLKAVPHATLSINAKQAKSK